MRMVGEEVYLKTGGRQRPVVNESLRRLLYFGERLADPTATKARSSRSGGSLLLTIARFPTPSARQVETCRASRRRADGRALRHASRSAPTPEDPAQLDGLLRSQTGRLKKMLAERAALKSTDPEIVRLSALADQALGEGALATAVAVPRAGQGARRDAGADGRQAEADIRARTLEFAEIFKKSAETYLLSADRVSAAADYARAFEQVRQWDDRLAWDFRRLEMLTWGFHGGYAADNAALEKSIALGEEVVQLAARLDADARGEALTNLGSAGHPRPAARSARNARDDAGDAAARRWTLYPADRALERARGQQHRRRAVDDRPARRRPVKLEQAVAAFRNSLAHIDRATLPRVGRHSVQPRWGVLRARPGDQAGADRAVRPRPANTLLEDRRDVSPENWASATSGVAVTMSELGKIDRDAGRLLKAAGLLQAALEEMTPERGILERADGFYNLASIHTDLGDITGETSHYETAVGLFDAALALRPKETAPLAWARGQVELAVTLERLAGGDAKGMDKALDRYRLALSVYTFESSPREWAHVLGNMGNVQSTLGMVEAGTDRLADAVECYRAALTVVQREQDPDRWATLQHYLGTVLGEIGLRTGDAPSAAEAVTALDAARSVFTQKRDPVLFADITLLRGKAGAIFGEARQDHAMIADARDDMKAAQAIYRRHGETKNDGYLSRALLYIDELLRTIR